MGMMITAALALALTLGGSADTHQIDEYDRGVYDTISELLPADWSRSLIFWSVTLDRMVDEAARIV